MAEQQITEQDAIKMCSHLTDEIRNLHDRVDKIYYDLYKTNFNFNKEGIKDMIKSCSNSVKTEYDLKFEEMNYIIQSTVDKFDAMSSYLKCIISDQTAND